MLREQPSFIHEAKVSFSVFILIYFEDTESVHPFNHSLGTMLHYLCIDFVERDKNITVGIHYNIFQVDKFIYYLLKFVDFKYDYPSHFSYQIF